MKTLVHYRHIGYASLFFLITLLSACGGSDGDSSAGYDEAYLQFYNGSPNGATVYLRELDGNDLGSAQFGDSSALLSLEQGDITLEFYRLDADDQEVVIETLSVSLKTSFKTMVFLNGDFSAPEFTTQQFGRETLDNHFRLMATSVMLKETQQYDLYMSEAGDPFEAANYLGTITRGELIEYTFWDGDSDSDDFDEDEYTLYLTEPGATEVVFESPTINFNYSTEYVLVTRDISGAIQNGMIIDVVLNSSVVTAITDVNAASQYRVYNSVNATEPVTLSLTGDNDADALSVTLAPGEMTGFTEAEYGDYRLDAVIADNSLEPLKNKLITLNQSESKAIVLHEQAGALASVTFIESALSQAYDKTINLVNLVDDYSDVDFYLVRHDETIDTAQYRVKGVEYLETETLVVPADYYEIIAVHEDNNDERFLLFRLPLYGFNEESNYIVTLESAENSSGYAVKVID
ncbi:DUF4397 domain-containing protein [Alteromonas gilva]|uniref:DUF4397 domain-containing protein n=1 Tax=Alteromonas gilva TaxID=2987522 RepID=A0ABT5L821_9ALTE|nr:DUF4397 domain-containing protein [Alteromonas gilva]MDC8833042.1 DUF4397 domain-containing protein [Alteromonas gilva]